jgi:hypothetical protein
MLMSKYTPGVEDVWKDPCGQEVYIGSLMEQKVYLNWQDVKDICTKEVFEAYEQTKRENDKLKELLKECLDVLTMVSGETVDFPRTVDECIDKINQALGENE